MGYFTEYKSPLGEATVGLQTYPVGGRQFINSVFPSVALAACMTQYGFAQTISNLTGSKSDLSHAFLNGNILKSKL
jgi:hypothetical protein